MNRAIRLPLAILLLAAICLAWGSWYGLSVAPSERYMGDTQRIMYVHVPTAWAAMLTLTWAFVCAVAFLFTASSCWDNRLEATIEISVLLCLLLSIQGAIWARPTWGVWWDWDPRLTTVAVLLVAFVGIAALRRFVEQPEKRATWSAVATIAGFIDVPIVYFSVKWWNSLHQQQSGVKQIAREFLIPLMTNFAGLLLLIIAVLMVRTRTAAMRLQMETAVPPLESSEERNAGFPGSRSEVTA